MALSELLYFDTVEEYRLHFERVYCRGVIYTHDNIRVYFSRDQFGHAFYECLNRDRNKNDFSEKRAERMNWIKEILENPNSTMLKGWNQNKRNYDSSRRVSFLVENFVVVLSFHLKRNDELKANFITCFVADNSMDKILLSPPWNKEDCINEIKK